MQVAPFAAVPPPGVEPREQRWPRGSALSMYVERASQPCRVLSTRVKSGQTWPKRSVDSNVVVRGTGPLLLWDLLLDAFGWF
jgi:hypothetical protein